MKGRVLCCYVLQAILFLVYPAAVCAKEQLCPAIATQLHSSLSQAPACRAHPAGADSLAVVWEV
jgi:hypothetical protein